MSQADEPGAQGAADDGVAAVLYGMFASFTEALDGFDRRLEAIEVALRAGPGETAERLRSIEAALAGVTAPPPAADADDVQAALASLAARAGAIEAAVEALHRLLQAHVDETSHSLGRRAGEAGRRLAADLGLRSRPRPGAGPPAP